MLQKLKSLFTRHLSKNLMIGFKGFFVAAVSIRMFCICFASGHKISFILVKSSYRDMSKKLGEKF